MRQRHVSADLERHPAGASFRLPGLAGAHRPEPEPGPLEARPDSEAGGGETELLLGELDGCVPSPRRTESHLEDQELASLISAFLRRLPREARVIFLRRYWFGDDLAAIAARLGCGQGKVKSSLFRTRNALRTYLEQEGVTYY